MSPARSPTPPRDAAQHRPRPPPGTREGREGGASRSPGSERPTSARLRAPTPGAWPAARDCGPLLGIWVLTFGLLHFSLVTPDHHLRLYGGVT